MTKDSKSKGPSFGLFTLGVIHTYARTVYSRAVACAIQGFVDFSSLCCADNTYNKAGPKELKDFEASLEVNESQTVAQQKTKTAVTWQLALKEAKQVLAEVSLERATAGIESTLGAESGGGSVQATTDNAAHRHGQLETGTGATTTRKLAH